VEYEHIFKSSPQSSPALSSQFKNCGPLDDVNHGMTVAIALYGTVVGALLGGLPVNVLGRKKTLFWVGVLYLVSAVGSALAPEV
jgi:SP family arabinose:H+ symporter-like MFS transporter